MNWFSRFEAIVNLNWPDSHIYFPWKSQKLANWKGFESVTYYWSCWWSVFSNNKHDFHIKTKIYSLPWVVWQILSLWMCVESFTLSTFLPDHFVLQHFSEVGWPKKSKENIQWYTPIKHKKVDWSSAHLSHFPSLLLWCHGWVRKRQ